MNSKYALSSPAKQGIVRRNDRWKGSRGIPTDGTDVYGTRAGTYRQNAGPAPLLRATLSSSRGSNIIVRQTENALVQHFGRVVCVPVSRSANPPCFVTNTTCSEAMGGPKLLMAEK